MPSGYNLYDGAKHRQNKKEPMSRSFGSQSMTSAEARNSSSRQPWIGRSVMATALVIAALIMAACSSGPDSNLQTPQAKPNSLTPSSTSNPKLPASTANAQQKVLNAWLAAEEQLYAYMDEPPAPLRADLVAGQTTTDLFPKLTDYYANPAFQSEGVFLLKLKTQLLNGPTTYNLGNPTVKAFNANTSTVTSCISDSGTTTVSGQPGPVTLAGGSGGYTGSWQLELISATWKITTFQTKGVTKC